MELSGLIMLLIVQLIRIYIGFSANRMESDWDTKMFLILTLACIIIIL